MWPMRKIYFTEGHIYHVYNRGVEKRDIFIDDSDRFRFLRSMYFCNNTSPAINSFRGENEFSERMDLDNRGEAIVRIHAFVLMPNHFHFLVEPLSDEAMTIFMHKLGTAYTMYFNKKYKRVGSLFQGPFKAIEVEKDSHFNYLPYYIHLNPLDLYYPSWREQKIQDYKKAINFLNSYKWSSYRDYVGKSNYSSLIYKELLIDILGDTK
jgi:putative transposase